MQPQYQEMVDKHFGSTEAKHPRNLDPSPIACYFLAVTLVFRESSGKDSSGSPEAVWEAEVT